MEDPIRQQEASLGYLGPQLLNMLVIHDAPFLPLLVDPGPQPPLWAPSLNTVIPPPALALRGPTWLSRAVSRLAESRAAPAEGHARGGTRRGPRPGRARQPDLLPLKGRGPDGGVARAPRIPV